MNYGHIWARRGVSVVRPNRMATLPAGQTQVRTSASASAGRNYISPQNFERIARSLNKEGLDTDACHALALYLRTSRDTRKRNTARTVLDALEGRSNLSSRLVSLVLAARLAASEAPGMSTLNDLCGEYPEWIPNGEDYLHLLHTLCRQKHVDALKVWRTMLDKGIPVPPKATNAVLSSALLHAPMCEVRWMLEQLGGIHQLDRVGLTSLLHGYCNRFADASFPCSSLDSAKASLDAPSEAEIHDMADRLYTLIQDTQDAVGWHAYITYQGLQYGFQAAVQCAESAISRQVLTPDAWTMTTLALSHIHHAPPISCDEALSVLARLQSVTSLRADRYVTALFVQALLGYTVRIGYQRFSRPSYDPGKTAEAQAFLEEVCFSYDLQPDAALLQPLIEAHCYAFVPALDAAYSLLSYLKPIPERSFLWRRARTNPRTDLGTYYPLLMACVRLQQVSRAIDLLNEMEHIHVPPHAASTIVVQLWGACTTYEEAWGVYRAMQRIGSFDAASYAHLLAVCCRLELCEDADDTTTSPMPTSYPLQLLGDMRGARFHPSPTSYTILLDYFAKSPRATLASVQATHELIKRDTRLEPDLILINALMNAYNHVQAPAQVLGIWDSLVVLCTNANSLAFLDEVSLVVVLDACGRSGLLSAARRALDTARQLECMMGNPSLVNKNALDAWIECLARCGRLEEAIGVLFTMNDTADTKTLQTLVRFAAAAHSRGAFSPDAWETMRARVRNTFPHLWKDVAQIV